MPSYPLNEKLSFILENFQDEDEEMYKRAMGIHPYGPYEEFIDGVPVGFCDGETDPALDEQEEQPTKGE